MPQRGELDITHWLAWFLGCLERAINAAHETLASVIEKSKVWERINHGQVNERQRIVINRLLSGFEGHLTNSKYAKLAKRSTGTALRDIGTLVKRGDLVQNLSGGRSTSYRLASLENISNE